MTVKEEFTIKGIDMVVYANKEKGVVVVKPSSDYFCAADTGFWVDGRGVIGKAVCHPDDKFDYSKGVQIATNRVLKGILAKIEQEVSRMAFLKDKFAVYVDNHTINLNNRMDA